MASRLDQALDEVIKDRRSERSNTGRRNNNNNRNNNNRDRNDFPRRRQIDNDGVIRKRLGPSDTIKSFVRTVSVQKNDSVRTPQKNKKNKKNIAINNISS